MNGGIGIIEEGKLKGKRFLIPNEVWIESGKFLNGSPKFVKGCLKHSLLNIPTIGCPKCKKEK